MRQVKVSFGVHLEIVPGWVFCFSACRRALSLRSAGCWARTESMEDHRIDYSAKTNHNRKKSVFS